MVLILTISNVGRVVLLLMLDPLFETHECDSTDFHVFYLSMIFMCIAEAAFDIGTMVCAEKGGSTEESKRLLWRAGPWMALMAILCWTATFAVTAVAIGTGMKTCRRFTKGEWW